MELVHPGVINPLIVIQDTQNIVLYTCDHQITPKIYALPLALDELVRVYTEG